MQEWQKPLKGDPFPWLLELENPSVRYWTLVDLLDRPADDPEVMQARSAIPGQALVQELLALQQPEGHWGADAAKPYTAEGAMTVLGLLYMLGVPPDARTRAGCDSFLRYSQNDCGGFSMTKTVRSGVFPCTTGEHLPFLVYFGMADDPRVQAAFEFMIDDMARENALNCGRYAHHACMWGAIAKLKGLAVLPPGMATEQSRQIEDLLANTLLDARYDFDSEHKRWLTLGVPRAWDVLSAVKVLAMHGYGRDPRIQPLVERLLALQTGDGRWLCGSVSRTWPIEKRGQPSKWVTLDALRALKQLAGE